MKENGLQRSDQLSRAEGYQRMKLCKRGYREVTSARVCGVSFEGCPIWLWSLRASDWAKIFITGTDEARLRQCHVSTWSLLGGKFEVVEAREVPALEGVDLWLLSGSLEFVTVSAAPHSTPKACWISSSGRRKPSVAINGWQWSKVCHSRVGGSTTSSAVFGFWGLAQSVTVPVDPIQRSIGHLLKYSERPQPCNMPFIGPHYSVDDRLSLHMLDKPVVFLSGFSRTGWGSRALVDSELGQAYDLPPFLSWEARFATDIVPLQLLRVALEAVGDALFASQEVPVPSRRKIEVPLATQTSTSDAVWLASIGKWLPGAWAEVTIADRAVKADNAMVDFTPWHNRVRLVLPCPLRALVSLEELGISRWRRLLSRSFRRYLCTRYGPDWASVDLRLVQVGKRVAEGIDPSAKRRRVFEGAAEKTVEGVVMENTTCLENTTCSPSLSAETARELERDLVKGRAVLSQVLQSSWWEWSFGSSLYFWRWNGSDQQRAARDGMRSFVHQALPCGRKSKRVKMKPEVRAMVAEKIEGMRKKMYLEEGHVTNSVDYFPVPKGEDDIRVVFDGSSCGLNKALWAPNFYLPSASSAVMLLSFSTWMSDMDFGEMFHNFPMEDRLRKCSGVEFENKRKEIKLLRWSRLFMGMRPSPYGAVRFYYWGEEVARGDPAGVNNPMGYDSIRLNLPGMGDYDPQWPKVMKWVSNPGVVAGDAVTFVDDVRLTGFSKENCHDVHRQFASRFQWLGMQDAPRKFRPPSQANAGAWTGTIFRVSATNITKSVTQEKWDKGRGIVCALLELCRLSPDQRPVLNRKDLERETGFLNHLSMTFEVVTPYLKGFYLTLNSWRSHRDSDGWKVSDKRWHRILQARREVEGMEDEDWERSEFGREEDTAAPSTICASPSFASDVWALEGIFSQKVVPVVSVRCRKILTVIYGFGDSSGSGLGATFTCGSGFNFRIGVWGSYEDEESSNWKEFTNVVEALEEEGEEGNLESAEVYMFTDNSTVESCVGRGTSSSPKLLGLVVRLQALSLRVGIKIHVFHVAGTRMIAQGTDGVSRGYLGHGVMAGQTMSAFIPIHLGAGERGEPFGLLEWIRQWAGSDAIHLDEMGWFQQGHDIEGWKTDTDGLQLPVIAAGRTTHLYLDPCPDGSRGCLGRNEESAD